MKREKIEKKFTCKHCGRVFTRMVPKKGKKPFYSYCGESCQRDDLTGNVEEARRDQRKEHRRAKRRARSKT